MTWAELNALVQKRSNQAYAMKRKSEKLRGIRQQRLRENSWKLSAVVDECVQVLGDIHLTDSEKEEYIKSWFMEVINNQNFSFEGCDG